MKWSWLFISSFIVRVGFVLGNEIERNLSVDVGSSIILSCTFKSENKKTWVGPSKYTTSSKKSESDLLPLSDGCDLNPDFNGTNIKVICNNVTGEYNLKVTDFSRVDEGVYKCVTSNFTANVYNLIVKRLPSRLTITTANENKSMTVVAEMNSSLLCQVHGGRPKEELKLKLIINDMIKANGSGRVIYDFTPLQSDHNASVRCEASSDVTNFTLVEKTRLNVQYPPKVNVTYNLMNGTLLLHCNPFGVPDNYTFNRLEQRSEFDEHIRFLNFSNNGFVLHTSIEDAGLQDTGIYVCNASNNVPDQNGRKFQSGKTLVELEGAPVFIGDDIIRYAKIGKVINISALVYNRHETHSTAIIQYKRKIVQKLEMNGSFAKVRKIFHGSNITLNASLVFFQLDLMTRKDFAIYILKICNPYGCRDIKIDIRIDTSKIQGSTRSKYQDVEIVFAALAVLSVLGIGMGVAFLIWKRVTDKDKSTLSQTEDLGEDTQGPSMENRLYQSGEIVNLDNPANVLQAQDVVYHAVAPSSQAEPTRNGQSNLSGSHLNYAEVVFEAGPSSNSNIIHGANDKTIYTEIDLASSVRFHHDSSDTSSDEDFIYIDGIVNLERKNEIK